MEKLKLEHLAPYLPYGLKFSVNSQLYPEISLTGINGIFAYGNYHGTNLSFDFIKIKPILRPLSDLTDDILKEIFNDNELDIMRGKYSIAINYQLVGDWFNETIPLRPFSNEENSNLVYSGWLFIELCKRHFDVFDLITQGLAIDKNTLK